MKVKLTFRKLPTSLFITKATKLYASMSSEIMQLVNNVKELAHLLYWNVVKRRKFTVSTHTHPVLYDSFLAVPHVMVISIINSYELINRNWKVISISLKCVDLGFFLQQTTPAVVILFISFDQSHLNSKTLLLRGTFTPGTLTFLL